LAIEGGFAVAPFAAHAAVGEWGRGAAFAATPTAMLGGTAILFGFEPRTVDHGTLAQQRVMWSLFGVGLFASAIGVIDVAFAGQRSQALHVAPAIGFGEMGMQITGAL
jgi:hypothetical protein